MLFDTHAHLDSEEFTHTLADVVEAAVRSGVTRVLTVATSLDSSLASLEIASRWPSIYASVGIHPNYCHEATDGDWEKIAELANHPRVVALGETGLDMHWDFCPFELQLEYFERHIRLSGETGLPFIVHMRDCEEEMMVVLERFAKAVDLNGIMHSFCGSAEALDRCLEWGMSISFAGMVTYPKNDELRRLATRVPCDRLLVETDSPWLSPHPHRKVRPNTPSLVRHTLDCLAAARREDPESLAAATFTNACRLFRIEPTDCPRE